MRTAENGRECVVGRRERETSQKTLPGAGRSLFTDETKEPARRPEKNSDEGGGIERGEAHHFSARKPLL